MAKPPKYALPEIERRWRVELSEVEHVTALSHAPPHVIEDLYITSSRLRLRTLEQAGGPTVYKLCKKYGDRDGVLEWITNLYLSADEHALLSTLKGPRIRKLRYRLPTGVLDVFEQPRHPFAIFEVEFESVEAAGLYAPPAFVTAEVTDDAAYAGAQLAAG